MTETHNLVTRLLAAIGQRETAALAASPGPWTPNAEHDEIDAADGITVADGFALSNNQLRATVDFIADNDPTAVLRRCAADRKIVGHYQATVDALAAAQGTILAGACKVRLGAYENVLHALAEGYGLTEQQKDQP